MALLGSLVIDLAANTARFQGDLGRAAAIAESRMRNIRDTASRALGAVTVIATAAGGALLGMFKQGVDRADDFRDMAQAVGITVESLSRLDFAAKLSGSSTEALKTGIQKLGVNLAEAAAKGGSAAEPFTALGINLRNTNGELKRSDEVLLEVADRFSNMEEGAGKTALAVALFGRAGAALIPLLNEGAAGIREVTDQADRLGLTISGKTAAAADQFNDRMALLGGVTRGFQNTLAAELLPTLNALSAQYLTTATAADTLDRSTRSAVAGLKLLASAGVIVQTIFSAAGDAFGAVAAAVVAAAQGEFSRAFEILKASTDDFLVTTETTATRLLDIWDSTAQQADAAAPKLAAKLAAPMIGALELAKKAAAELAQINARTMTTIERDLAMANQFEADLQRLLEAGTITPEQAAARRDEFLDRLLPEITVGVHKIAEKVREKTNLMSEYAKQAARNMQSHFANFLFDPFEDGIRGMLKGFLDVIRRMVAEATAAKIFGPKSDGGLGLGDLITGAIGSLFSGAGGSTGSVRVRGPLAAGGQFSAGDMRMVGERGPELAVFGKGGFMVPNHALGGRGTVVNLSIHNDNRGASVDLIRQLPEHDRRLAEQIEARVIEGIQRKRYDL